MHELGISEKDVYIASIADIVFEDVVYIRIYYGIYENETGKEFKRNMDGTSTDMYLTLGQKKKLSGYTEYMLGGMLGRYIGYGEITIYCKGTIKLNYDETTVIDAAQFCLCPEKYVL